MVCKRENALALAKITSCQESNEDFFFTLPSKVLGERTHVNNLVLLWFFEKVARSSRFDYQIHLAMIRIILSSCFGYNMDLVIGNKTHVLPSSIIKSILLWSISREFRKLSNNFLFKIFNILMVQDIWTNGAWPSSSWHQSTAFLLCVRAEFSVFLSFSIFGAALAKTRRTRLWLYGN